VDKLVDNSQAAAIHTSLNLPMTVIFPFSNNIDNQSTTFFNHHSTAKITVVFPERLSLSVIKKLMYPSEMKTENITYGSKKKVIFLKFVTDS